jgi:uncharacterized protein YdeI (YjbR/CyaY-like superfamily)
MASKKKSAPKKSSSDTSRAVSEVKSFATVAAWHAWLGKNHASSRGIWLTIAKKGATKKTPSYAEAVEVALIWGWIDGQKRPLDRAAWLQKFTPRGPKSIWSQINRDKADALIADGRMEPSGLAEVERAKRDGRWQSAYASQSRATVPPDLAAALKKNPRAARFFETLESRNRYAILFRVQTAKKPETRAARIAKFVAMLERGEKIHA